MTTATNTCSVKRSGVLTMFNGQTSTVAVPCKYRLADIQCGDYKLVVTPGSKLDSDSTFSPDTVSVNIKTTLKENLFVRTTARRLQRVSQRASFSPLLRYHILTAVSYPHSTAVIASVCVLRVLMVYGQSSLKSRQANKQQQQHVWWPSWFPKGHNASADKFSDGESRRKL